MENEKEYHIIIFNTEIHEMYLYSGLSENDLHDTENILDFLNVPYLSGETIENTYRDFVRNEQKK